jgi:hypothetical protein
MAALVKGEGRHGKTVKTLSPGTEGEISGSLLSLGIGQFYIITGPVKQSKLSWACWRMLERASERQILSVGASGPTARPAHATAHLINSDLDAALSGGFLLGRGDPTDPLVTRQRGNVRPKVLGCGIQLDRLSEICRQLVHCAVREFLRGHASKRACFA